MTQIRIQFLINRMAKRKAPWNSSNGPQRKKFKGGNQMTPYKRSGQVAKRAQGAKYKYNNPYIGYAEDAGHLIKEYGPGAYRLGVSIGKTRRDTSRMATGFAKNFYNRLRVNPVHKISTDRNQDETTSRQFVTNTREQKAVGDSGDDIKTKDSFVNKTGNKKFLSMQMLSGPRIIKYETTGGCLGSQGRAVWGFVRYKAFASTDANLWSSAGGLKAAEVMTNVNWRNDNLGAGAAPDWQVGDDMIQRGYLDRKFVLEKQVIKTEWKNQGKSPVHLEYYVVAYANSDATGRDVFRDVLDGYSATHGIQTSADLPNLLTATDTSEGRMDTNLEDSLGKSSIFRKNWNIKYKHKVRLPEGGVHEFTYVNDANRIINWNGIYKRNSANSDIELNIAAVKGITFHIIWKVYGSLGDNSTGINTVAVGGISTGDAKLIYRTTCNETYRHCMAAPRLVIDEKTRLPTNLTNIYDRDGGTGAQDDTMT